MVGNGIADAAVADAFDACGDEADFAGIKRVDVLHFGGEDADFVNLINGAGSHHADLLFFADNAVFDPHQNDDPEVGIVPAVNQKRFQGRVFITCGRRQPGYDRFQQGRYAKAGFAGSFHRAGGVEADDVFNLPFDFFRFGRRQVNLI